MPADYLTLATQFARVISGGQELAVEDLGKSGEDHCPVFTATVSLPNSEITVKGIGASATAKNAKHEAARDFIYCVLSNHLDKVLRILDGDITFRGGARPPNPDRLPLGRRTPGVTAGAEQARASTPVVSSHGVQLLQMIAGGNPESGKGAERRQGNDDSGIQTDEIASDLQNLEINDDTMVMVPHAVLMAFMNKFIVYDAAVANRNR